jgi:HEAT repeat protein
MQGRTAEELHHMLMWRLRSMGTTLTAGALFVCMSACEPKLPDDLPTLIQLMNRNSQTVSVNATIKVWKLYGKAGLLRALREDQPTARAMAAFRLREFPDAEIEQVLMDSVVNDADAFVRVQALWSLEEIGTDRALPVVERAINDGDSDVARKARDAVAAIRARSAAPRR